MVCLNLIKDIFPALEHLTYSLHGRSDKCGCLHLFLITVKEALQAT